MLSRSAPQLQRNPSRYHLRPRRKANSPLPAQRANSSAQKGPAKRKEQKKRQASKPTSLKNKTKSRRKLRNQKEDPRVPDADLGGHTDRLAPLKRTDLKTRAHKDGVAAWLSKSQTELSRSNLAALQLSLDQTPSVSLASLTAESEMSSRRSPSAPDSKDTGSKQRSEARLLADQLKLHHADPRKRRSHDTFTESLQVHIYPNNGHKLSAGALQAALESARAFIAKAGEIDSSQSGARAFEMIETFRQEINDSLLEMDQFTITRKDFQNAIEYSGNTNEAMLQRTVMISALDYWRLDTDLFSYDCEPRWRKLKWSFKSERLPQLKSPMPDMSVAFAQGAVSQGGNLGFYTQKNDIWKFVSPDARIGCCFPFLFIQAKKEDDSLRLALTDGTNCAVQALSNILECFVRLERPAESLLQNVRTFSISLNAERLIARSHRITFEKDQVEYHHDLLLEKTDYNRDEISSLIRCILQQYAKTTLLPELQQLYKALHEQYLGSTDNPSSSLKKIFRNGMHGGDDGDATQDHPAISEPDNTAPLSNGNDNHEVAVNGVSSSSKKKRAARGAPSRQTRSSKRQETTTASQDMSGMTLS